MQMKKVLFIGIVLTALGFTTFANATLIDNGGGLIYDTDLNITWYDANPVDRSLSEAMDWAANLKVTDSHGVEITGWRLPSINAPNSTIVSYGYANVGEMAHLYTEPSGIALYNEDHTGNANYGLPNREPFVNLQSAVNPTGHPYYWTDQQAWPGTEQYSATQWVYDFSRGYYGPAGIGNYNYSLAVHDGNVGGSPVPIPPSGWLLGSALVGLVGLRKRFTAFLKK